MDSMDKIIDYIAKVTKQPLTVNGKVITNKPVDIVSLSDKFFLKDDCHMCGRCCPNENTAFTVSELEKIKNAVELDFEAWGLDYSNKDLLLEGIKQKVININGQDKFYYSHPKDPPSTCNRVSYPDRSNLQRCHWLFEDGGLYKCMIHPVRSITCRMPHLRFFHNRKTNKTSMGVSQFGRNWALGCPIEFVGYDEDSVQSRIESLKILNETANDLGIKTYLPEILDYLAEGNRHPKKFTLKKRRKLI